MAYIISKLRIQEKCKVRNVRSNLVDTCCARSDLARSRLRDISVAQARGFVYNEIVKLLVNLVVNILTLMIVAAILPGFVIADWWTAVVAAVAFGVVNTFLKPVLFWLTLPLTLLTLGLFTLFINMALLMLTAAVVSGFTVSGWGTALLASILISLVSSFFGRLVR